MVQFNNVAVLTSPVISGLKHSGCPMAANTGEFAIRLSPLAIENNAERLKNNMFASAAASAVNKSVE
jgi:hypothetical protein